MQQGDVTLYFLKLRRGVFATSKLSKFQWNSSKSKSYEIWLGLILTMLGKKFDKWLPPNKSFLKDIGKEVTLVSIQRLIMKLLKKKICSTLCSVFVFWNTSAQTQKSNWQKEETRYSCNQQHTIFKNAHNTYLIENQAPIHGFQWSIWIKQIYLEEKCKYKM